MKYLLLALRRACPATQAVATPVRPELAGIWATKDRQFHDQALCSGPAIYLDADGSGAIVGGRAIAHGPRSSACGWRSPPRDRAPA